MRAPNLHIPHPHWPHPHWPKWSAHSVAFHRPSATNIWAMTLLLLLAAAILFGLAFAITNPAYYTDAYGKYPLAPM